MAAKAASSLRRPSNKAADGAGLFTTEVPTICSPHRHLQRQRLRDPRPVALLALKPVRFIVQSDVFTERRFADINSFHFPAALGVHRACWQMPSAIIAFSTLRTSRRGDLAGLRIFSIVMAAEADEFSPPEETGVCKYWRDCRHPASLPATAAYDATGALMTPPRWR